jgi:outer membrane murein-binding lipoprotein Lpp
MADVRRDWREIRAIESTLPEFVWLTSELDSTGEAVPARVVQVTAARAAQLLHAKTHRLATDEEVNALREQEEAAKRAARQESLRRRGIAIVSIP